MNPQYRVLGADQREYGPAGADELRRWIAEGRVNAQSLIQTEGTPGWRPIGAEPEFASALLAPAPFPTQSMPSLQVRRTNGMAVAGFLLSLFALFCCCCGPVPSILGLVFSCIGLVQTNRDPLQSGRGLAIAGIVLAAIGLMISLISMFAWVAEQH